MTSNFTELYIASAGLQQTLNEIAGGKEWHQQSTEYYYELDKKFLTVTTEIAKHDSIAHTAEPLEHYRELLTSVISEADSIAELSPSQHAFINEAIQKFYNPIWDFVAQEIALVKSREEQRNRLLPSVITNVEQYRTGSWETELQSVEQKRESVGLGADLEDCENLESGRSEQDDEQSIDDEMLKQISEMGAEVISD